MPRLSDSMEEGTVLQWLKRVGDEVAAGEPLVEIETDKANMVYEADVAGALTEILVADGETAPVGSPIARIGEPAASAPAAAAEQAPVPSVPAPRPARDRRGPSASPSPAARPTSSASSSPR